MSTNDNNAAHDNELLAAIRDGDPSLLMKMPAEQPPPKTELEQAMSDLTYEVMLRLRLDYPMYRTKDELIDAALRFDPLASAERVLGRNHKFAPELGFLMLQDHVQQIRELMQATNDTFMGLPYAALGGIAAELGFGRIYTERFTGDVDGPATEEFSIWWHPSDGMLLVTESYNGTGGTTNGAKLYYQWEPAAGLENTYRFTESGGFVPPPGVDRFMCSRDQLRWLGTYDGRTALRRHITKLRENGRFMRPWFERPFLWFVNYAETRHITDTYASYLERHAQYDEVTARKFKQLPAHVQAAIDPQQA